MSPTKSKNQLGNSILHFQIFFVCFFQVWCLLEWVGGVTFSIFWEQELSQLRFRWNCGKKGFWGEFSSSHIGSDHLRVLKSGSGTWKGWEESGRYLGSAQGQAGLWRVGHKPGDHVHGWLGHHLANNSKLKIHYSKLEQVPWADPGQVEPISINPRGDADSNSWPIPVFQFIAFWSVWEGIWHLSGLQHRRTAPALQVAKISLRHRGWDGWGHEHHWCFIPSFPMLLLVPSLHVFPSGHCGTPKNPQGTPKVLTVPQKSFLSPKSSLNPKILIEAQKLFFNPPLRPC